MIIGIVIGSVVGLVCVLIPMVSVIVLCVAGGSISTLGLSSGVAIRGAVRKKT